MIIGPNRRFAPNLSVLKAALDRGEIGKAKLLSITSFDPAQIPVAYIKVSGSFFREMMIHDFDMANFIIGAAPFTMSGVGTSIVVPAIGAAGDVETAVLTLTYADGRIATNKNSRPIGLYFVRQHPLKVESGNLGADHVAHAPCGFVSHSELTLELLAAYAVARRSLLAPISQRY
jgi:predicted dehydrogenase